MSRLLPKRLLAFLPGFSSAESVRIVGLSAQGAAWSVRNTMGQTQWKHVPRSMDPKGISMPALESLVEALALQSGQGILWILAPSLMRHWLQSPPASTASLSELHAVAQARAIQLFGQGSMSKSPGEPDWAVAADWRAANPFICTGIETGLHHALQQATGSAPQVFSPLMLTLSRFQDQLPRLGWLTIVFTGEFHVMQIEGGRARRLRSVRVPPDVTPSQLEILVLQEWQREMLRAESIDAGLHWLSLSPAHVSKPTSAALKPIRWPAPGNAPAGAAPLSDTEPPNEALHAAWCGHVLIEGCRA